MTGRALLTCAAVALLAGMFALKASEKMPDFEVYWRAGARAAAAEPLYREEDEHYQFKYLPAAAVAAIPLALVPLPAAKALWFALSAALVAVLIVRSLALLPERQKSAAFLATATLVVMAKFYGHELTLGQVNVLLGVTLIAAIHAVVRNRDARAGLFVGLAVMIKPYAVIFLPWLAVHGRRRALAAAALTLAGMFAIPAAVYGVRGAVALHQDWWRTVTESTAPNLLNPDNVSLAAMYAKWLGPGSLAVQLAAATTVALVAIAGVMVALRRRVPLPEPLEGAFLLTLVPLLSPQGWDYVFLLSTPAILFLLNYERALPAPARVLAFAAMATIAFSIYDVLGRQLYTAFMMLSIISVCYLMIAGLLLTLRVRRIA